MNTSTSVDGWAHRESWEADEDVIIISGIGILGGTYSKSDSRAICGFLNLHKEALLSLARQEGYQQGLNFLSAEQRDGREALAKARQEGYDLGRADLIRELNDKDTVKKWTIETVTKKPD